ncbi:hypothetical protein B0T18DRAFT_412803 [Schizothecium vesticola]|uniref:Uncharacterized protein n=1 Tax=Schizothecium vesticola TaxID=314040 RepID=A0AA40K5Q2_9PEZI|nr:hypothetical protein B0T18DRAFT_412803 [Schizothecium vesticola]
MSLSGLAPLAKAALYYEPALDTLVPASRRMIIAYSCQSNRECWALPATGYWIVCVCLIAHRRRGKWLR